MTIAANSATSDPISFTTDISDSDYGSDAGVTLSVHSARVYATAKYRVGDPSSVKVAVTNAGGTLTLAALNDETFLGGDILYTVTLDPAPTTGTTVSIAMEVSDQVGSSDLTLDPASLTIDDSGSAMGRVRVADTGTEAARTPVEIKISDSNANYIFSPQSVTVPIVDEPGTLPLIAIAGPASPINEDASGDVEFTLSAPTPSAHDLTIGVSFADLTGRSTNYVVEVTKYVVLEANESSVTISVPKLDNAEAGDDGVIVATLLDGAGYDPDANATLAYADIYDTDGTDQAVVTVSANATSVVEGSDVIFTLNRTGATTEALTVQYDVEDNGDLISGEGTNTVTIAANSATSDPISFTTDISDSDYGSDAGVTLSVHSARVYATAKYRVGDPSSVKVAVTNAGGTLTLAALNDETFLGGDILYTVTLDPAPTTGTTVSIAMEVSDQVGSSDLTLDPASLTIDDSGSAMGRVRVADTGTEAARTPVEIKISDSNANYIFSPQSVTVPIVDEPGTLPLIAIAGPASPINEDASGDVEFTLSAPTPSAHDLTIGVSFADLTGRSTNYVVEVTKYVVLEANESSVTISVPKLDNAEAGDDGVIVATLLDGAGYDPGECDASVCRYL